MTLVELLVVIVIVTTLVTTAIPIMAPGGDRRALREASRNLNAYLAGAQARAIQTGRPFGVALRPLSADTGRGADNAVCTTVEYVEVPAPFAGFGEESLCRIGVLDGGGVRQLALEFVRYGSIDASNQDNLPDGFDRDLVPDSYLRPGDQVEVYGETFELTQPGGGPVDTLSQIYFSFAVPYNAFTLGGTNGLLGYFPGTSGAGNVAATAPNFTGNGRQVFALAPRSAGSSTQNGNGPVRSSLGWQGRLTHDNVGNPLGSPEAIARTDLDNARQVFWTTPAPYKISRQPVPANGEALDLPSGAAIDLQASVLVDANGVNQLFLPSNAVYDATTDAFEPFDTPTMILFSPDGGIEKLYRTRDPVQNQREAGRVVGSVALCIGRRELIPAQPTDRARSAGLGVEQKLGVGDDVPLYYDEPIDLQRDVLNANLEPGSTEALELTDLYNWLNLDSRWVVIGAQSGSVVTVENSQADVTINTTGGPRPDIDTDENDVIDVTEQLTAAIENAPSRSTAGGR